MSSLVRSSHPRFSMVLFRRFSGFRVLLRAPRNDKFGDVLGFHSAILPGATRQAGFTLLEMLLVLFIMALVASAATVMTDGLDSQSRYDDTRRRIDMVKRAIAGDTARTINGQPDVGGFVADIGRPPNNLQELLQQGALPAFAQDSVSGLWAGWRGPYLDAGGLGKFHDGYGNPGAAPNYGWTFNVASGVVAMSSAGATSDSADDIGASELLVADDYLLPLGTVKINFHNRTGSDTAEETLKLRVYFPDEGAIDFEESGAFALAAMSAVQSVQATATFSPGTAIPIGTRAYMVLCDAAGEVFDGDCDGSPTPTAASAVHSVIAPRTQLTAFDWIMQ